MASDEIGIDNNIVIRIENEFKFVCEPLFSQNQKLKQIHGVFISAN